MNLKIQIISLLASFLFGMIFSLLVNLNYRYLFHKKRKIKIIVTILFILDMALIFFFLMQFLNGGIIHYYFYLMIFIGFIITFPKTKKLRKIKWLSKNVKKQKSY